MGVKKIKNINLTKKYWVLVIIMLNIFIIAAHVYGSYQYYISTLYIRIVDDVDRFKITNISNDYSIDINKDYLFQPNESDSSLGFALPIFFDRVAFTKEDFKKEYRVDMYKNDKKIFIAYICSLDKEKVLSLQYNSQSSRQYFYDINGKYYALKIKGQYLCFSQKQSDILAEILK